MDNTFSKEDFIYDINRVNFEVFASPISFQSRQDQKETHYGVIVRNFGKKYRYQINAIEKQIKLTDPVDQKTYQSKSSFYDGEFQIYRVTDNVSFLSYASMQREKIGKTYYPKQHTQFGPLGLRYHISEDHPTDDLADISYIPVFDTFRYTNPIDQEIESRTGIRHEIKIRINSRFTKKFHNKVEIRYAPFYDQKSGELDKNNLYSNIHTDFSYQIEDGLFMEYLFDYENDKFRSDTYNIKPFNLTQTFRFRYIFDL